MQQLGKCRTLRTTNMTWYEYDIGREGGVGEKQSRSRDEGYERENGHKGNLSPAVDFLADGSSVTTLTYDVIDFSRWRRSRHKYTSGFEFSDGTHLRFKSVQTRFRWEISIRGWVITTSGFGKQMSAILEMTSTSVSILTYSSLSAWQIPSTTHGGVMTSYRFFKMAAMAS